METDKHKSIHIGVTGHRNLSAKQLSLLEPVIKKAIDNIIHYHQTIHHATPEIVFTSAIAIGADTLFAQIALTHFKGELQIYLPFEQEEYLNDFDTPEEKHEFKRLLKDPKVKQVLTLNNLADGNRNELYLQAGKKITDESDYLIAVWNEQKAKGIGGTGDIAAYAIAQNSNILVINPDDPNPFIKANYLPHLQEYFKYRPRPDVFSNNIVEDYFNIFDREAVHNQHAYKRIWQLCFRIGWLGAALILAVKVSFNLPEITQFQLTIIEIICLGAVIGLIVKERKSSYHKNYLQYRFIAERLRVNNLLYISGYYPIKTETKVIHKAMQEIESKYPVSLINKIIRLTTYSDHSLAQKKEVVKSFALNQANYHEGREKRLKKDYKKNSHIKTGCLIGFAAIILIHVFIEYSLNGLFSLNIYELINPPVRETNFWMELSFCLYLFIPTTLARFEAIKYLNDWERLITQSSYMNEFFSEISDKVDMVTDEQGLYALLIDLNDNIYLENLDWEMFMVNKNEEIT
ncbi:MAG: hypothetical protein JWQ79_1210 [Mucilaginibacter sp.]|nr:hypothetical protein [Mucilaginibacter sp.]